MEEIVNGAWTVASGVSTYVKQFTSPNNNDGTALDIVNTYSNWNGIEEEEDDESSDEDLETKHNEKIREIVGKKEDLTEEDLKYISHKILRPLMNKNGTIPRDEDVLHVRGEELPTILLCYRDDIVNIQEVFRISKKVKYESTEIISVSVSQLLAQHKNLTNYPLDAVTSLEVNCLSGTFPTAHTLEIRCNAGGEWSCLVPERWISGKKMVRMVCYKEIISGYPIDYKSIPFHFSPMWMQHVAGKSIDYIKSCATIVDRGKVLVVKNLIIGVFLDHVLEYHRIYYPLKTLLYWPLAVNGDYEKYSFTELQWDQIVEHGEVLLKQIDLKSASIHIRPFDHPTTWGEQFFPSMKEAKTSQDEIHIETEGGVEDEIVNRGQEFMLSIDVELAFSFRIVFPKIK